jgi:hypothetical protein
MIKILLLKMRKKKAAKKKTPLKNYSNSLTDLA